MDILNIGQLQNEDEIEVFNNNIDIYSNYFLKLLNNIKRLNPHKKDKSFKNKLEEIRRVANRQVLDMYDLLDAKKKEVFKGLSAERIQQFLKFEADESHVGVQCQVCLEEFEVGKLIKQLDCGGRHSFCSVCINQWFANHKSCPICRHVFVWFWGALKFS